MTVFKRMKLVYKQLAPLVYLHVGLHIVSDTLAGKAYNVQRCWEAQYQSVTVRLQLSDAGAGLCLDES